MATKLDVPLGETWIVTFDGQEPAATGEGKFGPWELYGVVYNGNQYSFFPPNPIRLELRQLLSQTRTIAIEKTARQGNKGLIQVTRIFDPKNPPDKDGNMPEPPRKPSKGEQSFIADMSQMEAQTLKNDKDASITRAVAIKTAGTAVPRGTSPIELVKYAQALMPFLQGHSEPLAASPVEDINVDEIPFG